MSKNAYYKYIEIFLQVCKILTDSEGNKAAYKKLAEFNAITLEKSHETCMDYNYGKMVNELRAVEWKENTGGGNHDNIFNAIYDKK